MHRRLHGWDYTARCNYSITLVTEPRTPRFGVCREWGVERGPDARAVYDSWKALSTRFPQVIPSYYAIMPDHFHGVLYVRERLPCHLDDVVGWFRQETERRLGGPVWSPGYQDTVCLARGQLRRMIDYVLDNPKRLWVKQRNPGLFRHCWGFRHPRLPPLATVGGGSAATVLPLVGGTAAPVMPRHGNAAVSPFSPAPPHSAAVPGWRAEAPGLWRAEPGTLPSGTATDIVRAATEWTALGNLFLLDAPLVVALRLSRSTPPDRLSTVMAQVLAKVERGAVLVGPFISPAEREIKRRAIAAGGSLIALLPEGVSPFQKPGGADFDLCAAGRLLQLSPFPFAAGASSLSKEKCEWLNSVARAIADAFMGWPCANRP